MDTRYRPHQGPEPRAVQPPGRVSRAASPRPARILIVNWRCPMSPRRGGAEVHLHEIARRLVQLGHPVTVLTSRPAGAPRSIRLDGVRYERVGGERGFLWRHRPALRHLCAAMRIDLIIDDISKLPLAIHRTTDADTPTLAWCHHVHGRSLYDQMPWVAAKPLDLWERRLPRWYADTPVLAVSESTRRELIDLGLRSQRVGYARNAVNVSAIQREAAPKAAHPMLLYLGRLQPYKNVDCVLRGFARIRAHRPDATLTIVGSGPDEPRLRRLTSTLGIGGISFLGHVDQRQKHRLLHRAWLTLASSSKEGFGICVLEANAAGTPVIASDVPGHRDAVRHRQTGLLYPFDHDEALAEAALHCIEHGEYRRRLGQRARAWAGGFSWDRTAQDVLRWTAHFYPQLRPRLALTDDGGTPNKTPATSSALVKTATPALAASEVA